MKKHTLGFKLIAGGIVAVLLPLLLVGYFAVSKASNSLSLLAEQQVVNIAADLAQLTGSQLDGEMKIVRQLSVMENVAATAQSIIDNGELNAAADIQFLNEELADINNQLGDEYELIALATIDGKTVADSKNGTANCINVSDRNYFQISKSSATANIGKPVLSKASGNPVIPFCAPISDYDGNFADAILLVFKIDALAERFSDITVGQTGYPYMVDSNSLLFVHPNPKHILMKLLSRPTCLHSMPQLKRLVQAKREPDSLSFLKKS